MVSDLFVKFRCGGNVLYAFPLRSLVFWNEMQAHSSNSVSQSVGV